MSAVNAPSFSPAPPAPQDGPAVEARADVSAKIAENYAGTDEGGYIAGGAALIMVLASAAVLMACRGKAAKAEA